jgi:hypothetical protein
MDHSLKFSKFSLVLLSFLGASLSQACSTTGRLAEYDFRDRSLAAVTLAPPKAEIFSNQNWSAKGAWWEQAIRLGTEVVKERSAEEVRERLEEAAATVDVASLISGQVLDQAASLLRARPVAAVEEADFEIETSVKEYGIKAGSWDAQANFFLKGEVALIDSGSGRRIWSGEVDATEPINPSSWWAGKELGNIITAEALAKLSVEQIQEALQSLADFSAEKVIEKLATGLEWVGKR